MKAELSGFYLGRVCVCVYDVDSSREWCPRVEHCLCMLKPTVHFFLNPYAGVPPRHTSKPNFVFALYSDPNVGRIWSKNFGIGI